MNDDELKELFSAFDDVSAPESLKSSTLDFIMGAAPVAQAAEPAQAQVQAPSVSASRGGKARIRSKWHAMRVAAVAACMALALTGGAAYAYPASTVLVTQGDTTIELQVNVFGRVLSASASDEETQDLINQMGLVHSSFKDSVTRVSDSLKESNPEDPVEVLLNGVAQAVELGDAEPDVTGEEPESTPGLTTGEGSVQKVEQPVVESQPVAAVAAPAPEIVVVLPEPSGISSGDGQSDKADGESRATEREAGRSASDSAESTPEPSVGDDEGAADPAQAAADDSSGSAEDAQPADSGSDESPAPSPDVRPAEEPVYENTHAPRYYGDPDD